MPSAESGRLKTPATGATPEEETLEQRTEGKVEKLPGVFRGNIIIPYYLDSEYQARLEEILPHEQFEGSIPFEEIFKVIKKKRFKYDGQKRWYIAKFRNSLLAFPTAYEAIGYVGLDARGFSRLGTVLKDEHHERFLRSVEDRTIESFPIYPFTFAGSRILKTYVYLGLLTVRKVDGVNVYFPTERYVRMSV